VACDLLNIDFQLVRVFFAFSRSLLLLNFCMFLTINGIIRTRQKDGFVLQKFGSAQAQDTYSEIFTISASKHRKAVHRYQ
jgi:hypothetical protein